MRKFVTFTLLILILSYCKKTVDAPPSAPSSTPAASGSQIQYVNVKDGLNVRSTPSMTGSKVAMLRRGTAVMTYERNGAAFTVDGISGNWIRISGGGVNGWAFDGFLSTSKPSDTPSADGTGSECADAKKEAREKYDACEKEAMRANDRCPTCEGVPPHVTCFHDDMELRKMVGKACGEGDSGY